MYSETESLFERDCGCSISVFIKMFEKTNKQANRQWFSCSLFSLFHFFSIGVSPTGSMNCEITAQTCQPPSQTITVTPKDSKVTLKCSIKTGGNVQDMTWQFLERNLSASKGLYLLQNYSTDVNQSRGCFSIKYASEHVLLFPLLYFMVYIKTSRWIIFGLLFSGSPTRAKRAWDRAPYP